MLVQALDKYLDNLHRPTDERMEYSYIFSRWFRRLTQTSSLTFHNDKTWMASTDEEIKKGFIMH